MKCLGVDISRPLFQFLTSLNRQPPLVLPYNGCQAPHVAQMSTLRVALGKELEQPSLPQFLDELRTWAAGLSQVVQGCHEIPPASIVASLSSVVKRCGMYSPEAEAGLRQMEAVLSEQYCEEQARDQQHPWDALRFAKVEVEEGINSSSQETQAKALPPPTSQTWVLYHQRAEAMKDSDVVAEARAVQANAGQCRAQASALKRPASLAFMDKCNLLPKAAQVLSADEAALSPPGSSPGGHGRRGKGSCGKPGQRLTLADLESQFGVVLKQAAKNLNVCPTTLKRACRRHGVERWPRQDLLESTVAPAPSGSEGASQSDSLSFNASVEQTMNAGTSSPADDLLPISTQGDVTAMDAESDAPLTVRACSSIEDLVDFDLDIDLVQGAGELRSHLALGELMPAFIPDSFHPKMPLDSAEIGSAPAGGGYGRPRSPDVIGLFADFLMNDDGLPKKTAPLDLADGGFSMPGSPFVDPVPANVSSYPVPADATSVHAGTAYARHVRGLPELLQPSTPLEAAPYACPSETPWWLHQNTPMYPTERATGFAWQRKLESNVNAMHSLDDRSDILAPNQLEENRIQISGAGYLDMLLDSEKIDSHGFDSNWQAMVE